MASEMEEVVQSVIEKLGYDTEGRVKELEAQLVEERAKVLRHRKALEEIKKAYPVSARMYQLAGWALEKIGSGEGGAK